MTERGLIAVLKPISHKIRSARQIDQKIFKQDILKPCNCLFLFVECPGELPAHDRGISFFEIIHHRRTEGFHAIQTRIIRKCAHRRVCQRLFVTPLRFQFHDQRHLAVHQTQKIAELWNAFVAFLQRIVPRLCKCQIFNFQIDTAGALETGIVDHRQLAVARQMQVQLNAVSCLHSPRECRHRVLRDRWLCVQPPMRVAMP